MCNPGSAGIVLPAPPRHPQARGWTPLGHDAFWWHVRLADGPHGEPLLLVSDADSDTAVAIYLPRRGCLLGDHALYDSLRLPGRDALWSVLSRWLGTQGWVTAAAATLHAPPPLGRLTSTGQWAATQVGMGVPTLTGARHRETQPRDRPALDLDTEVRR